MSATATAPEMPNNIIENVFKQLIRTTVAELHGEGKKYKELRDYPPVLRAHHIQELMQVSEGKAYEILRSIKCPTKRFGKIMTVPRDEFWAYYLSYEGDDGE